MTADPEKVDWSALTHAYGAATDVPRLLRTLSGGDAGAREAALDALYGNLLHQGTLYPATPFAVPALIALVGDDDTPDRPPLLLYLAALGRAASLGDEPWYADTQAELERGVGTLAARLSSPDQVERLAATVALAWADEGRALARRLPEIPDDGERLVTVYALAAGRAVPDPNVLAADAASAHPAIRLAARLGQVRAGRVGAIKDVEPEAYALLAEVIGTVAPQTLPQPVELLDSASVSPATIRALAGVLAASTSPEPAVPLVEFLLEAVMPDGMEEPLDPIQADVLTAISQSPGAWVFGGNTLAALAAHDVDVTDQIDLCARLGLDHPEMMDSEDTQSLLAGSEDTGMRWEELDADQKRVLERFVDVLDRAGWNESRNWHAFVTAGPEFAISPIGVGRHFNEHAVLEATLWFFDEHVAADTGGDRTGDPYVRLLVADKAEEQDPIGFRAYYGDQLDAVLQVIDRHRPTLDRKNFGDRFLHDLFDAAQRVEVELADGRVVEIRPRGA